MKLDDRLLCRWVVVIDHEHQNALSQLRHQNDPVANPVVTTDWDGHVIASSSGFAWDEIDCAGADTDGNILQGRAPGPGLWIVTAEAYQTGPGYEDREVNVGINVDEWRRPTAVELFLISRGRAAECAQQPAPDYQFRHEQAAAYALRKHRGEIKKGGWYGFQSLTDPHEDDSPDPTPFDEPDGAP